MVAVEVGNYSVDRGLSGSGGALMLMRGRLQNRHFWKK